MELRMLRLSLVASLTACHGVGRARPSTETTTMNGGPIPLTQLSFFNSLEALLNEYYVQLSTRNVFTVMLLGKVQSPTPRMSLSMQRQHHEPMTKTVRIEKDHKKKMVH